MWLLGKPLDKETKAQMNTIQAVKENQFGSLFIFVIKKFVN